MIRRLHRLLLPQRYKQDHELRFWKSRVATETVLSNAHYRYFYTKFFGLTEDFYSGKRILDIGCGPRGSLEWADMALQRVGLDPLANEYLKLGADKHKMTYVSSPSEKIPFDDGHFDVVTSFNSLDHVHNLNKTVSGIKRVLKPGGTLLLIVEVNHPPSSMEPITLPWNVIERDFLDTFSLIGEVRKYEIGNHNIYNQLQTDARFDESHPTDRPGLIAAHMVKRHPH